MNLKQHATTLLRSTLAAVYNICIMYQHTTRRWYGSAIGPESDVTLLTRHSRTAKRVTTRSTMDENHESYLSHTSDGTQKVAAIDIMSTFVFPTRAEPLDIDVCV